MRHPAGPDAGVRASVAANFVFAFNGTSARARRRSAQQLVGAYEGLPADYGHREPYLRSFDDIPAHQDASKCDETGLK